LGTLLSYVNEPTDRKSPDQDRETRFLLAYFFFASAQPGQASDVLEDLVKEFPSDSQFVALRQAVRRIQETERRPAVTEP